MTEFKNKNEIINEIQKINEEKERIIKKINDATKKLCPDFEQLKKLDTRLVILGKKLKILEEEK